MVILTASRGDRGGGETQGDFSQPVHPLQSTPRQDWSRETLQAQTSSMKSYHLKWSQHLANMGIVFSTLYQSEGLSDVTLACDDGKVRAHKLLLSTCSDFFLVSLRSPIESSSSLVAARQGGRVGALLGRGRVMIRLSAFLLHSLMI